MCILRIERQQAEFLFLSKHRSNRRIVMPFGKQHRTRRFMVFGNTLFRRHRLPNDSGQSLAALPALSR